MLIIIIIEDPMFKKLLLFTIFAIYLSSQTAANAGVEPGEPVPLPALKGYATPPDFEAGKPFVETGHTSWISSISVTPDGKYLITGADDTQIKIWSLAAGKEIKTLSGHFAQGVKTEVTPDGSKLVSCGFDGQIIVWDIASGQILRTFKEDGWIVGLSVTRDSKNVIISTIRNRTIMYDIETGKQIQTFPTTAYVPILSKVTPDNMYFAMVSKDSVITIFDINTGKTVKTLKKHDKQATVNAIFFAPNEKTLYSCDTSGNVYAWDTKRGSVKHNMKKSGTPIFALSLSADGKTFFSGGEDKTVNMWDTETGKLLKTIELNGVITGMVTLPNSTNIAVGTNNDLSIISTDTGEIVSHISSTSKWKKIDMVLDDKDIFKASIVDFSFTNDININHLEGDKLTSKKLFHSDATGYLDLPSISKNMKRVASYNNQDGLTIIDADTGKVISKIKNSDRITPISAVSMSLSEDGKYIIALGFGTLEIIDVETGKSTYKGQFKVPGTSFYIASIKLRGNKAYMGGMDMVTKKGIVAIYDLNSHETITSFLTDVHNITGIAPSPDGKVVAAATSAGTLHIFDSSTGQLIKDMQGNANNVGSLEFTKDGKLLVSAGVDKMIRYWDIAEGKEILANGFFDDGEWISITPDGYFAASENGAKHLLIQTGAMEVSSIDQYYEQFYRPDIVASAAESLTDGTAYAVLDKPELKLAEIKPAPSIEIINAATNIDTEDLKIELKITPKAEDEYGQIRLYVDGALIKTDNDRALHLKESELSIYKAYTIKLPKGEHSIKAIVFNKENTMQSKDAVVNIVSTYEFTRKPNIYAVVIGINKYKNPAISLKYAVDDARLFAETIKESTKSLFGEVNVSLLTTEGETSKEHIANTLKSLQNINPQDMFIFYVASHGLVEDAKYHMITSNVGALSTRKIQQDAISQDELKEMIANIPTTKKFIILDTCNSGAMGKSLEVALLTRGLSENMAMKVLSRAVGSTIISASSSAQEALEGYKGHGLLTYILTQGLRGEADTDKDGFVKTLEIANYVEDTVPEIAEKVFKRAQYPYVSPLGAGFPLTKTAN
jgi:WD40 repeat protein